MKLAHPARTQPVSEARLRDVARLRSIGRGLVTELHLAQTETILETKKKVTPKKDEDPAVQAIRDFAVDQLAGSNAMAKRKIMHHD